MGLPLLTSPFLNMHPCAKKGTIASPALAHLFSSVSDGDLHPAIPGTSPFQTQRHAAYLPLDLGMTVPRATTRCSMRSNDSSPQAFLVGLRVVPSVISSVLGYVGRLVGGSANRGRDRECGFRLGTWVAHASLSVSYFWKSSVLDVNVSRPK